MEYIWILVKKKKKEYHCNSQYGLNRGTWVWKISCPFRDCLENGLLGDTCRSGGASVCLQIIDCCHIHQMVSNNVWIQKSLEKELSIFTNHRL